VGVLVSTLQFFKKVRCKLNTFLVVLSTPQFMGLGYKIEFRPVPDGPTSTDVFPEENVRPLNRKKSECVGWNVTMKD
jgi:hypothetical protein